MQKFIKSSLDYIEQNLKTDITSDELAQMTGYSVGHYCRMFKQITDLSVTNYISKKRINYALAEISSGRKAIDVVLEYGFDTYAGFYKAFVKMYGCSPTKYLNIYKNLTPEELEEIIMDYNKLAEEAMKNYDIKHSLIEFTDKWDSSLISIHVNTIEHLYKVTDDKGEVYDLRLTEFFEFSDSELNKYDAATDKAMISSIVEWVGNIDYGVPKAEYIKNIHGEYTAAVADRIYCTLTKQFKGNFKTHYAVLISDDPVENHYSADREIAENYIKSLAKLHKTASEWITPAGFIRPSFDVDSITCVMKAIDNIEHDMSNPDVEKYKKCCEIIKLGGQKAVERFKANPIEKNNMTWGLIHGNNHSYACHIFDRIPAPYDHHKTIFGYYLYDIAKAFHLVAPKRREWFLEQYSKIFPLPKDYISHIETFYVLKQLNEFYHSIRTAKSYPPEDTSLWALKELGWYLKDEPFLFKKAFFLPPCPWDHNWSSDNSLVPDDFL